jgi:hypothetical protein
MANALTLSPVLLTTALGWHCPLLHVPPRQSCPHEPQFFGSLPVSTQAPPHVVWEHLQSPAKQEVPVAHAVWFCHVPPEEQSCGIPPDEHCLVFGVQSLQPPALNTQTFGQVCAAGMVQVPLLQVPIAWKLFPVQEAVPQVVVDAG